MIVVQEYDFANFRPKMKWDIEHCTNITEDTYHVQA